MKAMIIALAAIVALNFLNCKDNGAGPPPIGPDTTSHTFSWTITSLGDGGGSILNDVTILNDTLAFAAGEIYLADSTGTIDPTPYCFARWDGVRWRLERMKYFTPGSIGDSSNAKGRSIFANSVDDIWLCAGAVFHWNGIKWNTFYGTGAEGTTESWCDGKGNCWFVGRGGTIVFYNGASWQKLASGTNLDVGDIWGAGDPANADYELLAVAGNPYVSLDRKIMKIMGSTVTTLSDSGISQPLSGIWFVPKTHYYVAGGGIFEKLTLADPTWRNDPLTITRFYTNCIRGEALNDVFACGAFGEMLHYNGASWRSFQPQTGLNSGQYLRLAVKGNLVIAVGYDSSRAVVAIGRR